MNSPLLEKLITYRRELHEHPELSMKEYETTKRIRKWLEEAEIPVLDYQLEVGVVAEITGNQPGPIIALRADIDALPIKEETFLPFASKNEGVMHACGHDFHTASIIGAAILLQERRNELKGKVRIIFQPAEEISQGAVLIEKAGVLDGVEAIFGMHNKPDLPVGTIGVREGALMASVDRFEIEITGVGGHAGIPNNTIDPIVITGQIISALQTIVSRNLSSFHNAVISITQVHAGTTWNVIPEKAELEGTVRTFQNEARQIIPELMKRTAEGIASAYGARADFHWYPYMPVVDNSPMFTKVASETARKLGYEVVEAVQSQAGEDFAFYQTKLPGFFVWMGVDGSKEWHHPAFHLKEEALQVATDYFTNLTINVLDQWEK
ncbi:amidohydrolase [Niallia endozanthoxylica]|uniref:Amidohydrolase n=2 Tax=Niallia endozanthoxylica TaxID=2036016 RepID=A0A5J5HZX4_9BACI|nr:amidohydrolase [Niallia endozanthoxylica]